MAWLQMSTVQLVKVTILANILKCKHLRHQVNVFICIISCTCRKCLFPMPSNSTIFLQICNFEHAQRVQYGDSSGVPISHLDYLYDWMAPEQLSGKPADQPGDVFSFGILVWECVTGKRSREYVKSLKQLTKCSEDPRLQKIPGNCSQTLKDLIGDCLKSAENRPNFQQVQRAFFTTSTIL